MDPQTTSLETDEVQDCDGERLGASGSEGRVTEEGKEELSEMKEEEEEEKATITRFTCDLCDIPVDADELEMHVHENHAALLRLCDHYLSDIKDGIPQLDTHPEYIKRLAEFVEESVAYFDKGPAAFDVVLHAYMQLERIVRDLYNDTQTFLFGSCVSYGCWDGVGDADFVILRPAQLQEGNNIPDDERRLVLATTRKLRDAGFLFEELEPVLRTSVPVVRRVQKVRAPLHIPHGEDAFKIKYEYHRENNTILVQRLIKKIYQLHGTVESCGDSELTAAYKRGIDAVAAFRQTRRAGLEFVTWSWKTDCLMPEIFYLDFDVSYRPFGLRNSWLMRLYLEQSPEVRAGAAFLKKWSKQSGINNPMRGFLTSYAVNVLWVSYLLHVGVVEFVDPASVPLLPEKAKEVSYMPLLPLQDPSYSSLRLGELLAGFFEHYSGFAWDTRVASLRVPSGSVCRSDLGWVLEREVLAPRPRDRVWYRLCVEDPYEADRNLARHLSPVKATFVHSQFFRARQLVRRGTPEVLLVDVRHRATAALTAVVHRAVFGEGVVEVPLADAHNFFAARIKGAGEEWSAGELLGYYELNRSLRSLCKEVEEVARSTRENKRAGKLRRRRRRRNRRRRDRSKTRNEDGVRETGEPGTETTKMKETNMMESKPQEESDSARVLRMRDGSDDKGGDYNESKKGEDERDDVGEDNRHDAKENKKSRMKKKHRDKKGIGNDSHIEEKARHDEESENEADDLHRAEIKDRDDGETKNSDDEEDVVSEGDFDNDDGKGDNDDKVKVPPFLHACFLETEEKMRLAGRLGIPAAEVPEGIRGAYFFAYDRAFYTLEGRDTFERHACAIMQALSESSKIRADVRVSVQGQIPTAVRDDTLIDEILDAHSKNEWSAIDTKETSPQPVVRTKPTNGRVVFHSRGVRRAPKSCVGVCSECHTKDVIIWPTNDPSYDRGLYCDYCWKVYETRGTSCIGLEVHHWHQRQQLTHLRGSTFRHRWAFICPGMPSALPRDTGTAADTLWFLLTLLSIIVILLCFVALLTYP
ncbi:PAP/25A-associated [Trypanosoma melophagium]|uniref:PAP/25A-associated n=1 Tax=Trypanosoma melophagium TaxID=715481 RepID=UPI00351A22A8|nr:PAP/25A-associated [Trypanosoma melophagium]